MRRTKQTESGASGGRCRRGEEVNTVVWVVMFWKRRDFQLTLNARLFAQINCELLL